MTAVKSDLWMRFTSDVNVCDRYGDWRITEITEEDLIIEVGFLLPMISYTKTVKFSDIAWKGKDFPETQRKNNCVCCGGERYRSCDTSFPGILLHNGPNPMGLPYRMMDGKHRVEKMLDDGLHESTFYIIKYDTFKQKFKSELGRTV